MNEGSNKRNGFFFNLANAMYCQQNFWRHTIPPLLYSAPALPAEAWRQFASVFSLAEAIVSFPLNLLLVLICIIPRAPTGERCVASMALLLRIWAKARRLTVLQWEQEEAGF